MELVTIARKLGGVLPIRTERLWLRRFQPQDYQSYCGYHTRSDVYRFNQCDPPQGEELRQQFEEAMAGGLVREGDAFHFALERREDGTLLGEVLLRLADREALQAEIGYVLHPSFFGRGYATEAASAVVDLGFSLGFHRIFARLDSRNVGSIGVMERLGFRREAHFIENSRFKGTWSDEYVYALLAREWQRGK